jgi:hypothetical protein
MADPSSSAEQIFDLWKRQLDEGAQTWARLMSQTAAPPPDPLAFWRPVFDQGLSAWARILATTPASPDLMTQWKQFLDQWIEAWSRAFGQAMATEGFAEMLGHSLEQWLAASGPARRASEQSIDTALQSLRLPSRDQVTGVARQIVDLEDRLERLEDAVGVVLQRLDELVGALPRRGTTDAPPGATGAPR